MDNGKRITTYKVTTISTPGLVLSSIGPISPARAQARGGRFRTTKLSRLGRARNLPQFVNSTFSYYHLHQHSFFIMMTNQILPPLSGVTVIEFGGLAPAPFCGMVLADFGATVVRIDRIGDDHYDVFDRGNKINIKIDIKSTSGGKIIRELLRSADVLIDPYRPGVLDNLGFGPTQVLENINSRIIYTQLTGYGQSKDTPERQYAGHDINYIAASGVLDLLPNRLPPINLLADFAGGGLMCALGVLLALRRRDRTGTGEVIDCNMVHGVAYLSTFLYGMIAKETPVLNERKNGGGILRFESHFYNVYETLDGRHLAVGAIERKFYQKFLQGMHVEDDEEFIVGYVDSSRWPGLIKRTRKIIKGKSMEEWMGIFDLRESCVSPVLTIDEAERNPNLFSPGGKLPKRAPVLKGSAVEKISSRTTEIMDYLKSDVVKGAIAAGVVIVPKIRSNI